MTKVEHTKTHEPTLEFGKFKPVSVIVTDAELVSVECKPEEALLFLIADGLSTGKGRYSTGVSKYYKPILISRTEKIEVGDWIIVNEVSNGIITQYGPVIKKAESDYAISPYVQKVLALPEHFSPQSLQDIVDGKLKEGKLLVELFETNDLSKRLNQHICACINPSLCKHCTFEKKYYTKLNPHITIYPVEEKMYTLQEISEKFIGEGKRGGYFDDYLDYILLNKPKPRPTFNEWFQQNMK